MTLGVEPRPRPKLVGPRETDVTVYSEPYQTPDGTTIITVTRHGRWLRSGPRPLGVFVIRDGEVQWSPAIDASLIGLIGVSTGLIAATLATVAMVRRPPWPDLHITR